MTIVIRAENIGKQYRINHEQRSSCRDTLRDALTYAGRGFWQSIRHPFAKQVQNTSQEEFWALKEIGFEIEQGDRLGIIGRNGAGKSTLLKILSRIIPPSTGRITINGRVASLLEVGTGFHPELTGRENVFLNGAILGMRKQEIKRKFDEIVEFAEVEKFLDTPVKHYSSGMYVRLAFAVAAHLEPEILIVDEVLAVGDLQFQKKCIGKMEEVGNEGKTILFVSHNMSVVQRMCNKGIYLESGKVLIENNINACVTGYLKELDTKLEKSFEVDNLNNLPRMGTGIAKFKNIVMMRQNEDVTREFKFSEPFNVRLVIDSNVKINDALFGFSFISSDGIEIQGTTAHDGGIQANLAIGENVFECSVSPMLLVPGKYYLRAAIAKNNELFDYISEAVLFSINEISDDLTTTPLNHRVGYIYCPYKWKIKTCC